MRPFYVVVLALLLVSCDEATDPQPYRACLKTGEPYACRGGPCFPCIEYGIVCPKPTTLTSENNKLVCRLNP